MRRFYVGTTLVFFVALLAAFINIPARAQGGVIATEEPKPVVVEEKQGTADQWVADKLSIIDQRQGDYFSQHGQYFQGLVTHSADIDYSTVNPDASAFPDALDSKPTDQAEDWLAVFPELQSEKMPGVLSIHIYDGPSGAGYVILFEQCIEKQCYQRSVNRGPEEWRTTEWLPIKDALR